MKDQLINVLELALNYARCCNEFSNAYEEEEKQYEELLHKIKKENYQDFSKEEINIILDACDNAYENVEINGTYNQNTYESDMEDISSIMYKFKN
ncbi:MAG: hypothetical protein J1F35_08165 [Erysipelotrichales bacterium]|nr:hypothetical protein [Erysipelotrichales bacterium]